jgi:S-disulfanyl-L-cysteine oxidoreductase SoxD
MRAAILLALVALAACDRSEAAQAGTSPRRFRTIGRDARPAEIRAWDIDVNASGAGLPAGRGTYARGVQIYAQQCASCHGPKGEGTPAPNPNPKLIGGPEPRDFSFGRDPKLTKTIGNYWPYATTLFDYINRAMPFATPGVLPANDVYSVVTFLLAENGIIQKTEVMDARTLPKVKMPARDRFVADDRKGGAVFK